MPSAQGSRRAQDHRQGLENAASRAASTKAAASTIARPPTVFPLPVAVGNSRAVSKLPSSSAIVAPTVVFVTASSSSTATTAPDTALNRFGAGGLAGIIAGSIVAFGLLVMGLLLLIKRMRKRKAQKNWWGAAGQSHPPVLDGSNDGPLMTERDPDRSSDTLIGEKTTGLFKSKSNASGKSQVTAPYTDYSQPLPSPNETAPLRPRRPSVTGLDEKMRRKKDTIMGLTDAYGSDFEEPVPAIPEIHHALATPRQSVADKRQTVGPAAVQPGYVSSQRRSHQPGDIESILDSLADPSQPSGFSQSAGSINRKPRPPTLLGIASAPLGSAPNGLSPITEKSTPSEPKAYTSSVRSRDGYEVSNTMSVHSSYGAIGGSDSAANSPTAATFGQPSPMPALDVLRRHEHAPISPLPPLTPFEHVPVLGLATLPPREDSRPDDNPATPSLVSTSVETSPRMSEGFALSGIGSLMTGERPPLPTPTESSLPTTPATGTFGRQSKDYLAPLGQMNLAKQQPDYRSPTLSLYGAYSTEDASLL